jgi:hypothetical protein
MVKYAQAGATFSFADDAQIEVVFGAIAKTYEDRVDAWLSGIDFSEERAVLLSLSYNGLLAKSPSLKAAVESGNRAEAWYEIRYQSNGDVLNGIAKRRYFESEKFGLYKDSNNITEKEAKDAFKMFTEYEFQMAIYDTDYDDQLYKDYNIGFAKNLENSLSPAKTYLESKYNSGQLVDNILIGDHKDVETADVLTGTDGKDLIFGDAGNDTLNGGADSDTYIFNDNFGKDIINDSGATDNIRIDGSLLSGEAEYVSKGVYQLDDYRIETSNAENGGTLKISVGSTSNTITIDNFISGDFNLTLQEEPENPNPPLDDLARAEAQRVSRRSDPLTLDLNHNGQIDLISLEDSTTFFDLEGDGLQNRVGWVGNGDGLLVLDENGNGVVDNIDELFGHQDEEGNTVEGTTELTTHDLNNDGRIDSQDAIFEELTIWQDLNSDGTTDEGELKSLSDHNITSINLNTTPSNQNIGGNVILSKGIYEYDNDEGESVTGTLANLDLAIDKTNAESYNYQDSDGNNVGVNINPETLFLPFGRGYGTAKAWHIAMSEDACCNKIDFSAVNTNKVRPVNDNFANQNETSQNILKLNLAT